MLAVGAMAMRKAADAPSFSGENGWRPGPISGAKEGRAPVWSVFRALDGSTTATPDAALSSKYRLAGTFFAYSEGAVEARKAVVDDVEHGIQKVVSEQDDLGSGIRITRIERDRIIIRDQAGIEAELWLSFRTATKSSAARADGGSSSGAVTGVGAGTSLSKFGGRQVGDCRWIFSRDRLMEYYQELRDDPERLLAVFDSMKPVYDAGRRITGYRLDVEGEAEFFEASGLKPGDVVRSVNFMDMTNRRRAEFLISQFIRNEANAFIIDIERDGEKKRLIYEIR